MKINKYFFSHGKLIKLDEEKMISKVNDLTIEEFNQLINDTLQKVIGPLEEKIEFLTNKLDDIELIFLQEEELKNNEINELDIESKETTDKAIPWKKLRAELKL